MNQKHSYKTKQKGLPLKNIAEVYFKKGDTDLVPEILSFQESEHAKEIISQTSLFVEKEMGEISSSQMRNLYGYITKSVAGGKSVQLQLLRPKLAYVAARQIQSGKREENIKPAISFFDLVISKIENLKQMKNFKEFFESIVAFHKYHHPKS